MAETIKAKKIQWPRPFAGLQGLTLADVPREVSAGVTLAALMIPLNIGYAQVAGLPPAAGLYAAIIPLVVFALLRQLAPLGHEPRRLHGHPGRGRPRRLRRARRSAAAAVRPGAGRGLRGAVFHLLDLPAGVPRQLPLARRDGGLHHRARRRGVHQPGPEDPRRSPCGRRHDGLAGGGGAPQGDPGDLGEHRGLLRGGPRPDPLHSARQPLLGGGRGERLPDRPADEAVRAKNPRSVGGSGAADDPRRGARPPGEGRRRARQHDPLGAPGADPAHDSAGRLPAAAARRPGHRGHSPVRRSAGGPQLQQQVRLQGRR